MFATSMKKTEHYQKTFRIYNQGISVHEYEGYIYFYFYFYSEYREMSEELVRVASIKFIYLFIYGCVGSLFLCEGFL